MVALCNAECDEPTINPWIALCRPMCSMQCGCGILAAIAGPFLEQMLLNILAPFQQHGSILVWGEAMFFHQLTSVPSGNLT